MSCMRCRSCAGRVMCGTCHVWGVSRVGRKPPDRCGDGWQGMQPPTVCMQLPWLALRYYR
eukprot:gene15567-biopygen675